MKKIGIAYLSALLLFCFSQCAKPVERATQVSQGSVYPVFNNGKSMSYQMTFSVGHSGKNCSGCVKLGNGMCVHIDCQGLGTECTVSTNVVLSENNSYFTAVTTDTFGLTDQAFFNMPSRSLFVEYDEKNNEVWLNIPAQLVFRDSVSHQFTFTGLYYSNSQIYEND